MVSASVISEKTRAICFTSKSRARLSAGLPGADLPGVSAITIAPTNGTTPVTVSQGNVLISLAASQFLQPHQQERADQQHRSDQHGQRIRADESRLHLAHPPRRP